MILCKVLIFQVYSLYCGLNNWFFVATTMGGYLQLTIEQVTDVASNHNMSYRSGMVSVFD